MVRDYLAGKRKEYFNFIGFLVILLAVEAVIWQFSHNSIAQIFMEVYYEQLARAQPGVTSSLSIEDVETVLRNQKISFLVIVPLAALGSWLILRRTGYNYAEHIVAISFLLALNTLLGYSIGLVGLLPLDFSLFKSIYSMLSLVVVGYGIWFYWQFSQQATYTKGGRTWRVVVAYLIVVIVLSLGQQFFMGMATGNRTAGEKAATEAVE